MCACVLSCVQLFVTFVEKPGSSLHGVSQARILELPSPSSGDLPGPVIEPTSPALASGFFTPEPPRRPLKHLLNDYKQLASSVLVNCISYQVKCYSV